MSKSEFDELYIKRSFNVSDFRSFQEENKTSKTIEGHPVVFDATTNIGNYFYERIERSA